jgi:hypothetical protein
MWLDLVTWTWTVVSVDAYCCQGDGSTSGRAADAFPVFGCIVEPTVADAFWAAGAAAATLFAGSFVKWCDQITTCFASEAAPEEAEAAFFVESSFDA